MVLHVMRWNIHPDKREDYLKSSFFAFGIKKVDKYLKWDKTKPLEIIYISTPTIVQYLKSRNLYLKYKTVKIGIEKIRKMKKFYPSSIQY